MSEERAEPLTGAVGAAGMPDMIPLAADDAPTQQLGLTAAGDRCVACGVPLSSDQRYCVNCGERRSAARFTLSEPAPATDVAPRPASRHRAPAGATLVAGIGTLLLAMGVGVLIGTNETKAPNQGSAAKVQVLTVGGGSGASTTTAPTGASAPKTGRSNAKSGSKSKAKSRTTKPTAAAAKKANTAANKVLGSNANLPPATVTQGQAGHGPGYSNGHFSGTFFGH